MDAGSKGGWLIQGETRGEHRGVEEQPDQVLDGLVVLVLLSTCTQCLDDCARWVELHGLLGSHVARHGAVLEGLGLHDTLHVGRPAVLASHQAAWGAGQAVSDNNLLSLVAEHLLDQLAQVLAGSLLLLPLLLLLVGLFDLEALLGDVEDLLAVVLLELLDGVLINWGGHVQHLETSLLEGLQEGCGLHSLAALASDAVDLLLVLLHAGDVVLEGGHVLTGLAGGVPHQVSELVAVLAVLVDTELEVLRELLPELVVVLSVLSDLVEHLDRLLDKILLDDLEDLRPLEHLSANVKGKVLGVDNALDEGQEFGDELLAVVGDEHTAHVQLDVVALLGWLEAVEWGSLWYVQDSLELELTLDREVLYGEMLFPIVGDVLVEG